MPLFKCTKCHHEWEGVKSSNICDWCGSKGRILEDLTPLEKMIHDKNFLPTLKKLANKFKKEKTKLCDYGCGRKANYQLKNGKWCCSSNWQSCPKSRQKNSEVIKNAWRKPETRKKYIEIMNQEYTKKKHKKAMNQIKVKENISKAVSKMWKDPEKRKERIESMNRRVVKTKHSDSRSYSIERIKKLYPTFSAEEEMRYNPDKPGEKEIQVHCKYNKCKNSKENNGWFTPTRDQLERRRYALDNNDGNDGAYLYCSEECKKNCCLYKLRSDPNTLSEFKKYQKEVWKETNESYKKYHQRIKNWKFRGKKGGYDLDHKYSIYDGFINNINPKTIGHWKNLECITLEKNRKKNKNSSITLRELLEKTGGK